MSQTIDLAARGLLAAIKADPGDDFPRLAYADWCEENGQPERAEFIRLQLELARLQEPEYKAIGPFLGIDDGTFYEGGKCTRCRPGERCPWHTLAVREDELIGLGSVPPGFNSHMPSYVREWWWWRGFIERVRLPLESWLQHGNALYEEHPLRRVEASDKEPSVNPDRGDYGFWGSDVLHMGRDNLLLRVWSLLKSPARVDRSWKWWHSQQEAVDALSDALLALVRGDAKG